MSTIGTFNANGAEYTGAIATLTIKATDVSIIPTKKVGKGAPSHRVYAGRIEIGAAWPKQSRDDNAYLSLKLDDPSLIAPVYARLMAADSGQNRDLVRSRSRRDQR